MLKTCTCTKECCRCQVGFDLGRLHMPRWPCSRSVAAQVWWSSQEIISCRSGNGMAECNDSFAGLSSFFCHSLLLLSSGKGVFILWHCPLEIHISLFDFTESHSWELNHSIGTVMTLKNLEMGPHSLWNGHKTLETKSWMSWLKCGVLSFRSWFNHFVEQTSKEKNCMLKRKSHTLLSTGPIQWLEVLGSYPSLPWPVHLCQGGLAYASCLRSDYIDLCNIHTD